MVYVKERNAYTEALKPFLKEDTPLNTAYGLPAVPFLKNTPGLKANAYYFGQPKWAEEWLQFVHRSPLLKERWYAAAGSWEGKVVVDIGCGPGNLQANFNDRPAVLIGVDVSPGALNYAVKLGYLPLLADAHQLPLRSGFADVVAMNATIHHCDDMEAVIAEAARLVKPGGVLVADHDPHLPGFNFRGPGKILWNLRTIVYRLAKKGGHRSEDAEQEWAAATEIHHKPGDGLTEAMLRGLLEPMGFAVSLFPHNHRVGKEILEGGMGRAPFKMQLAQRLSGMKPGSREAALSLLCVAKNEGKQSHSSSVVRDQRHNARRGLYQLAIGNSETQT